MVLEPLGQSLRLTLKKIANATHVDSALIKEVVKDIQRALLQADVNVKLVLSLTKQVETRALTEKPAPGMSSREHVIRIIYDELVKILGKAKDVGLGKHRIMMVGLYGQGKTTTCGKLARYFQRKGLKVGLIAADVHRPAARDQLRQLGEKVNVPVFTIDDENDAVKIAVEGVKFFEKEDIVIIDTSGRHALEDDLIQEMMAVERAVKPDEKFLVIDAQVGQQAGPQAKAFHDAVQVTGVIITKMDGSAKGGGALSAVSETKAPVVFIGVGEHIEDLEKLDPPRFISRLLGLGDLQSLLEKAGEVMDEETAEKTARKMIAGKFTLKDMYEQMEMLSNMGPLKKLMSLLPGGLGAKLGDKEIEETQKRLKKFKIIMNSMTKFELENPREIKYSRIKRIALGSGVDAKDVRDLLKYYETSRKAMKGFVSNRKMRKAMEKQMKAGGLPGSAGEEDESGEEEEKGGKPQEDKNKEKGGK